MVNFLKGVYFEDVDWCLRAKKTGFKSIIVPQGLIWHKVSVSQEGIQGTQKISSETAFYQARNSFIFAKKNLSGLKKFLFLSGQITFRLCLNLILCKDKQARQKYLLGIIAGRQNNFFGGGWTVKGR